MLVTRIFFYFQSFFFKVGPAQIESICRQQHKCRLKFEICLGKGEKKKSLDFLLFPKCFLKATFSGLLKVRVVNIQGVLIFVLYMLQLPVSVQPIQHEHFEIRPQCISFVISIRYHNYSQ